MTNGNGQIEPAQGDPAVAVGSPEGNGGEGRFPPPETSDADSPRKPRRTRKQSKSAGEAKDAASTPDTLVGAAKMAKVVQDLKKAESGVSEACQTIKKIDLIPVRKPNLTDFIRVHPDDGFAFYEVPIYVDKDDRGRLYLMDGDEDPDLIPAMSRYLRYYNFYYYVTSTGDPGLWPIVLPKDGDFAKWNVNPRTATERAVEAIGEWVQVHHHDNERGYYSEPPKEDLGEPNFPDLTSQRVFELSFKGFIIRDFKHPLVKKCLGLK